MRRFRYAADPLFLCGCGAYALNRWVLKPNVASTFLHGYFNDLLLIPCALPLALWMQRRLGLRKHDNIPDGGEVLFHLAIWCVLFELIGPHLIRHTTGDPLDMLAYAIGALLSWAWWRRRGGAFGVRQSPAAFLSRRLAVRVVQSCSIGNSKAAEDCRTAPKAPPGCTPLRDRTLWEGGEDACAGSSRNLSTLKASDAFQRHRTNRNGFDLLAPHYFWMECLLAGNALQKCRTAHLQRVRIARSALILGEGNGRFLSEFLHANQEAKVVCVDASARMLAATQRRLERGGFDQRRLELIRADVLELAREPWPWGSFDLVVTHFFLDCFRGDQLETLLPAIAQRTIPGAAWLIADFRIPEGGLPRARARIILRLAYAFFRLATQLPAATLTAPDTILFQSGFQLQQRLISQAGLLHSDVWTRD